MKYLKLYEEFNPDFDMDMIKMMLLSCEEVNIELIYSMNDSDDVDELVEELFSVSWIYERLYDFGVFTFDAITIKDKLIELVNRLDLYFDSNQISELPYTLSNYKKLIGLSLNGCGLIEIPKAIFDIKNLESLYISDNNITNIPKEITKLEKLKYLDIERNKLTDESIQYLKSLDIEDLKLKFQYKK
jgi:hypothetical protein